jgi:hypothetical protein
LRRTIVELGRARRARLLAALTRATLRGAPMVVTGRRRLARATEAILRDVGD